MAYEICKRCGKMFQKDGKTYCKDCFKKTEREYGLIKEHIRKYPKATVLDIITETGVSLKSINCLIEDGDISYIENKLIAEDVAKDSKQEDKISIKKGRFYLRR